MDLRFDRLSFLHIYLKQEKSLTVIKRRWKNTVKGGREGKKRANAALDEYHLRHLQEKVGLGPPCVSGPLAKAPHTQGEQIKNLKYTIFLWKIPKILFLENTSYFWGKQFYFFHK